MCKEKVAAMKAMFGEMGAGAGDQAGRAAARTEAVKAVQDVASRWEMTGFCHSGTSVPDYEVKTASEQLFFF